MKAFNDNLAHPGPLLAAFDFQHDGCVLLFQVRDRSLVKLAETSTPAEERESLVEQMLAKKVRVGATYATSGFTWAADESGMSVWHDRVLVWSRDKAPVDAAEVVLFVDRLDDGHRGVRLTLSAGTTELVAEEHDPTPGLDPTYDSADLSFDSQWAFYLGEQLAIWSLAPFVDERTGKTNQTSIVVARAGHAASDQLLRGVRDVTVPLGAIGRSPALALHVPASQDKVELRIDLADGGVVPVMLKRGTPQQLAAYLRRVSTPREIVVAMNRAIEARKTT